jgi:CrcB protein
MSGAAPTWLLVAVAGGIGTLARYALGGWLARTTGASFPWETLAINVAGSLAIGGLAGALDRGALLSPPLRMSLMAGILGGFTTFSSFALETLRLAGDGQWRSAGLYVALSNAGGLAAAWIGRATILAL